MQYLTPCITNIALLMQVVLASMLILCAARRLRRNPSMLSAPSDQLSAMLMQPAYMLNEHFTSNMFCLIFIDSSHHHQAMSPAVIFFAVSSNDSQAIKYDTSRAPDNTSALTCPAQHSSAKDILCLNTSQPYHRNTSTEVG